jgi:proline iminopeptidase
VGTPGRARDLAGARGDLSLHVRELGEGSPVVVLHAGPGLDGSIFLPGAELLAAAGYRLLLVDLPGNGRSPDPEEWTLAAHARALEELVRERGLEDWTLLGHSFGGFVSMQHLVDFPGSAARLIASCTDADEEPAPGVDEEAAYANLPPEVEAAFELEERVTSDEEARDAWLGQLPFFAPTPEGVAAVRAAFSDVVYRHRAVLQVDELGELHALGALAAAEIPVLAIVGSEDRGTPPEAAQRIADTAPRGELAVLDGVGHFPFAEAPERYWGAVRDWLDRTR